MKQWTFWDAYLAGIKEKTPNYPDVFTHTERVGLGEYQETIATMVRIFRRGVWWKVMVLEKLNYQAGPDKDRLLHGFYMRFQLNVYNTIYLYQLCGMEDMDTDQTPETERLQKLTGL